VTTDGPAQDTKAEPMPPPPPPGSPPPPAETYLAGLRVLDLSRVLAGPIATQVLADLGAEVLKVEPPGGDDTRAWGPHFQAGQSAYFQSCNRNKASLLLDLKEPGARARLNRLVGAADVLVHNYLPATARRLGLDVDAVVAAHPRLVALAITGYSGSRREEPGYDLALQAEAGWIGMTGPPGPPDAGFKVGVAVVDLLTGLLAANGIQAALLRRARTGRGAAISISLQRSALFSLINVATNHLVSGQPTRRWGNQHPNLVPYQVFAAADRAMVLGVGNDAQYRRLCELLPLGDVALRELDHGGRLARRDELVAAVAAAVARWPASELVAALRAAGIPAAPLLMPHEAIGSVTRTDPGAIVAIAHRELGEVRLPAPPIEGDGVRVAHSAPPQPGEGGEALAARWLGEP
jgi:crotonobetainyl-CoA:carnitine CoA-transferase CaiB-like acyl-CoA transferase